MTQQIAVSPNGFSVSVLDTDDVTGAHHRHVLVPGNYVNGGAWTPTALTAETQAVQTACATAWTSAVIGAYQAAFPYVAPPKPSTNPLDYVLTKHQVTAALILAGVTTDPDTFVMGVLNTIPDAKAKALAINDWNFSPTYHRDNALFNDPSLLAASGITSQQIDQFWLLGAQQPV